jgi:peptide/nickel transport system permease protein
VKRVGAAVLVSYVALAAVAGAFGSPTQTRTHGVIQVLHAPSAAHWLGTDDIGRDVMSRLAHGARTSLAIAALAVALSTAAGLLLALAAAGRRRAAAALGATCDALGAVPPLLLVLTARGLLGAGSIVSLAALIALPRAADVARVALGELERALALPHVEAARAVGATRAHILARHALPLAWPQLGALAAATCATAVLSEAALSFLGVGVTPPTASWGELIAEAHRNQLAWWLSLPGGLAVTGLALAAGTVADYFAQTAAYAAEPPASTPVTKRVR